MVNSKLIIEFAEKLTPRYGQLIFTTAYKLLLNAECANDVTQETLLKLIKIADRLYLLDEKALKVYIYRAAYNNTLMYIKKNPESIDWNRIAEFSKVNIEQDITVSAIENKEARMVLIQCINMLSDVQRDLILLKYFEGLDNKMIAETLGMTVGSVYVMHKRALDKLKKLLQQYDVEYLYVSREERLEKSERFIAGAIELSQAYEIDMDIQQTSHCIKANIHLYHAAYPEELTRMLAKLISMCDKMSFFSLLDEASDFTLSLEFYTHYPYSSP